MKKCIVLLCIVMFSLAGCTKKQPSNPQAEKAALETAQNWLQLMDSEDYVGGWDQAAEFFRNAVTKEQWESSAKLFRTPLGKLVSRKVKSKQYTTTAPGAPDGEYVIIQFDTSFENKKTAIETITPMKDKDGKWRVSGYFIK